MGSILRREAEIGSASRDGFCIKKAKRMLLLPRQAWAKFVQGHMIGQCGQCVRFLFRSNICLQEDICPCWLATVTRDHSLGMTVPAVPCSLSRSVTNKSGSLHNPSMR